MSTQTESHSHSFKGSWRWTKPFENWVRKIVEQTKGPTANIFAGLSPIGDVRIDLRTPVELIKNLQEDPNIDLPQAREYLQDFATSDVNLDPLYEADNPTNHPLAEHIKTSNTLKLDILNRDLPFQNNSFEIVICDPPWKNIPETHRTHILEELVRITTPGGTIVFNGYWIPTGQLPITIDYIDYRQDIERYGGGNPNISWVCKYTVHDCVDTARHLSQTLGSEYEFTPPTNSLEQTVRAAKIYELTHIHNIPYDTFVDDIIDPNTEPQCPQCNSTQIDPVGGNTTDTHDIGELYQCAECGFRAREEEIQN